ncbi:hypothetical protein [Pseudooceanicola sp.]|uniref:hypothetical protein n=1 Tax=Pseudooceanicola sp. TaxID=1914328 RepID=UPI0035C689DF
MIELLVVIAIATIGVVYTSSTGEAESKAMADKSARDALDDAEGQGGIGILGIDVVARKMRQMVGLPDGAISAETLAEYRGDDESDAGAELDALWEAAAQRSDRGDDEMDMSDADDDIWTSPLSEEESPDWADPELQEQVIERARLAAQLDDPEEAEAALMAGQAEDEADADVTDAPLDLPEELLNLAAMDAYAEERENATGAPAESGARDEERATASKAAKAAADAGMETEHAPIVEGFDPEQDQILISYRPGEAGNGRIGIMEDPLRPGSAAVTLGGRCVAVVQDGFGAVMAHHIELVCEEDDGDLAAA